MHIFLRQSFPLGRFHATPWRVNPFDDAYGEWPPSPWRLVRAVVARWYQWRREWDGTFDEAQLDALIAALCGSSYRFRLPPQALHGSPLRQYHPVEFEWNPADEFKGKGENKTRVERMRSYSTSLVQDNYWCVPDGNAGAVFWFIDGDRWTEELVQVLDRCVERINYFGRAESLTRFDRPDPPPQAQANCMLREGRAAADAVRVLVPSPEATRRDIERVTADAAMTASVPPGRG
jgi:CRISPR-associated protein Csb2